MDLDELIKKSGVSDAELKIMTCAIAATPHKSCRKITNTLISLERLRASVHPDEEALGLEGKL
jgi:hypothetical protein